MKLNVPPHPILDREAQDGEGPKGGPPHSSAGRKLHLGGGEQSTGTRDGKEGRTATTTPGEILGSQKAEAYLKVPPP